MAKVKGRDTKEGQTAENRNCWLNGAGHCNIEVFQPLMRSRSQEFNWEVVKATRKGP